jgi:hypothetical protein
VITRDAASIPVGMGQDDVSAAAPAAPVPGGTREAGERAREAGLDPGVDHGFDPGLARLEWNRLRLARDVARVHGALERHLAARAEAALRGGMTTAEPTADEPGPARTAGGSADGDMSGDDTAGGWPWDADPEATSALDELTIRLGLSPFERDVLVLTAAVELDAHVAELVVAALSDPTRSSPTFGLCLSALPGAHWSAITPAGPLRAWRLLRIAGDDVTGAGLRIDERVLHYLLGIDELDAGLRSVLEPVAADAPTRTERAAAGRAAQVIAGAEAPSVRILGLPAEPGDGWPRAHIVGGSPDRLGSVATATAAALGATAFRLRPMDIPTDPTDRSELARLCAREWHLAGVLLVVEPDTADDGRLAAFVDAVGAPVVILGDAPWSTSATATTVHVPARTRAERLAYWVAVMGPAAAAMDGALSRAVAQFDLSPGAIRSVMEEVGTAAADASSTADPGLALWDACRMASRPRLDGIAERIDSAATWEDLVLPAHQVDTLHMIASQVRNRHVVYEDWGFARRGSRGLGISSLFAGEPGTGKTMAAEVLANELRLDLYRIDLAGIVSKYIGETEKNLRRLFDAAEGSGAILLFDEADALFGRRSEVHDSHDRYANIEVSYLLQRMEASQGLTVLTTNRKEALDPAFLRRLRFIVRFPYPDARDRAEIWRRIFPAGIPTRTLDFQRLGQLNVAGGHIRNIALAGAFLAADRHEPLSMALLTEAARVEYLKLDRSLSDAETRGWS